MTEQKYNETKLFSNPKTLTFRIAEMQQNHKEATGDFTILLSSIQTAWKFISKNCEKQKKQTYTVKKYLNPLTSHATSKLNLT